MAIIKIKLEEGECPHEVKERLVKALQDDMVKIPKEKYNDQLMEDLVDVTEKEFSKMYLAMVKDIVKVLQEEV